MLPPPPGRSDSYRPTSRPKRTSPWHLQGFSFIQDPMVAVDHVRATLLQQTYMPVRRDLGSQDELLRYRTNLRMIFEVVVHFNIFWGRRGFWTRIRNSLEFDPKTAEADLEDVVLRYCQARVSCITGIRKKIGSAFTGVRSFNRIAELADIVNNLHPSSGHINEQEWTPRLDAWRGLKHNILIELGVLPSQKAAGICTPGLRDESLPSPIGPMRHGSDRRRSGVSPNASKQAETIESANTTHPYQEGSPGAGATTTFRIRGLAKRKDGSTNGDSPSPETGNSASQSRENSQPADQPMVVPAALQPRTRKRSHPVDESEMGMSSKRQSIKAPDSYIRDQSPYLANGLPSGQAANLPSDNSAPPEGPGNAAPTEHIIGHGGLNEGDPTNREEVDESRLEKSTKQPMTPSDVPSLTTAPEPEATTHSMPTSTLGASRGNRVERVSAVHNSIALESLLVSPEQRESTDHMSEGASGTNSEAARAASIPMEIDEVNVNSRDLSQHRTTGARTPEDMSTTSLGEVVTQESELLSQKQIMAVSEAAVKASIEDFLKSHQAQWSSTQARVESLELSIKKLQDSSPQQLLVERRIDTLETLLNELQRQDARSNISPHASSDFALLDKSIAARLDTFASKDSISEQVRLHLGRARGEFEEGMATSAENTRIQFASFRRQIRELQDQIKRRDQQISDSNREAQTNLVELQHQLWDVQNAQKTGAVSIDISEDFRGLQQQMAEMQSQINDAQDELDRRSMASETTRPAGLATLQKQLEALKNEFDQRTTSHVDATHMQMQNFQQQMNSMQEQVELCTTQPMRAMQSEMQTLRGHVDTLLGQMRQSSMPSVTTHTVQTPPSVDLDSTATGDVGSFLNGISAELTSIRERLRRRIREMDAAHEPDDDKKFAISDISYEVKKLSKFTTKRIKTLETDDTS